MSASDEAIKKAKQAINEAEKYNKQIGNEIVDGYHHYAQTYLLLAIAEMLGER